MKINLKQKKYFGFTLVELIIVITILAILATISFVSFQGYTKTARDSVRLENMSNIEKALELFNAKSGNYPLPDNNITISLSLSNISFQGTLGDTSSKILGFSKNPVDPLYNSSYYYATNANQKGYSLISFGENQTSYIGQKALADNSNKFILTKGNLSYLLDANNNALTGSVDLFGNGSGTLYNQILNSKKTISGSGVNIGGGYQALALKNGDYRAPTKCPDGFIPVVGSSDFSQPGFCVMKYEASYDDATTPNTTAGGNEWNTFAYNSTKNPVSKAGLYPIADITQQQAIDSCNKIGAHLITNNEWMTIARQIESNSVNWSNGIVGSGYISNGVSNDATLGCGSGNTRTQYPNLPITTRVRATKTGGGFGTNPEAINCDKKRQLTLSNSEVIWDISGNIWEHVNKNNAVGGTNYNAGFFEFDTTLSNWSGNYQWHNTGWNATSIPDNIRQNYGPSNSTYNHTTNGIGNIHGKYLTNNNNIFIRGGHAYYGTHTGLFALHLHWIGTYTVHSVGFRCVF